AAAAVRSLARAMSPLATLPRPLRRALWAVGLLAALAVLVPLLLNPLLAAAVHAFAHTRGLDASWRGLAFRWPATVALRDLTLANAESHASVLGAEGVEAGLSRRWTSLQPRVARLVIARARIVLPAAPADDDAAQLGRAVSERRARTAAPSAGPAAPRVRAAAQQ